MAYSSYRFNMSTKHASPSKKLEHFEVEQMKGKPVNRVPGVGAAIGGRLAEKGYDTAEKVYAEYLQQDKNKHTFKAWVKEEGGGNERHARDAYYGCKEWYINNQ